MKKDVLLIIAFLFYVSYCIVSCKKSAAEDNSIKPITTNYTEEFADVQVMKNKDWRFTNNSTYTEGNWVRAMCDKYPCPFAAWSFSGRDSGEFLMANRPFTSGNDCSSWLITPVLQAANGDKISFYTRCYEASSLKEKLEVYQSSSGDASVGSSPSSTGSFTTKLLTINETGAAYPLNWVKYEYTFTGLSGATNLRIGFRYAPRQDMAQSICLDFFQFIKQ